MERSLVLWKIRDLLRQRRYMMLYYGIANDA